MAEPAVKEANLADPRFERIEMPEHTAAGYRRHAAEIEYSSQLARRSDGRVIVNVNRDQAREIAQAAGYKLSTAAVEMALEELGYKHEAFNDTFARNKEKTYYWHWTDTSLLKPKGQKDDYIQVKSGRKYWLRTITEAGEPVGELWIPQGGGKVVKEMSPLGLPSETSDEHGKGSETHFYFDPDLEAAAVLLGRSWCDARVDCFSLDAYYSPSHSDSSGGLRLVRGALPEYEKLEGAGKEGGDYRLGYLDGKEEARKEFLEIIEELKGRIE